MTTQPDLRTEPAVSAGGVVFRPGKRGAEVVLCGRTQERLWALPKGTPEYGESFREAAEREVREETGLGVRIVADLGTIEYAFVRRNTRYEKVVHHFLLTPDGSGSVELHDREYDRVEWFPAEEAMRIMTHRNEQNVLRRALDAIESGAAA